MIDIKDDDDIETAIQVRLRANTHPFEHETIPRHTGSMGTDLVDHSDNGGHGKTINGDTAFCRTSNGPFNCQACLEEVTDELLNELDADYADITQQILSALQSAGHRGLSQNQIAVSD